MASDIEFSVTSPLNGETLLRAKMHKEESISMLKKKVITTLASPSGMLRLLFQGVCLQDSATLDESGIYEGASINALWCAETKLFCTRGAIAALKGDGSVVTWGHEDHGGNCSVVKEQLTSNVATIYCQAGDERFGMFVPGDGSFAALKTDGSLVSWGSLPVPDNLKEKLSDNVQDVYSTGHAFAALKKDGSVVTWGSERDGGVSPLPLDGVQTICANRFAFAALKIDGSVVTWGHPHFGGEPTIPELNSLASGASVRSFDSCNPPAYVPVNVQSDLMADVRSVHSCKGAFAAIKKDGSVVVWGTNYGGADPSKVKELTDVQTIQGNAGAFAALRCDGSVVTWGSSLGSVCEQDLMGGVRKLYSSGVDGHAFAAHKNDGSVYIWGTFDTSDSGGGTEPISDMDNEVRMQLAGGVQDVFFTKYSFAALKSDGSVVAWGYEDVVEFNVKRLDMSKVQDQLADSVQKLQCTHLGGFAALKEDGSVVTFGSQNAGGDSSTVREQLSSNVDHLYSTYSAFAAVKKDGSLVTWGAREFGGTSVDILEEFMT